MQSLQGTEILAGILMNNLLQVLFNVIEIALCVHRKYSNMNVKYKTEKVCEYIILFK